MTKDPSCGLCSVLSLALGNGFCATGRMEQGEVGKYHLNSTWQLLCLARERPWLALDGAISLLNLYKWAQILLSHFTKPSILAL